MPGTAVKPAVSFPKHKVLSLGVEYMPVASTAKIHPSAFISPEAEIADHVQIGPFALIDGPAKIGANSEIKAGAKIFGNTILGTKNIVFSNAVIGEAPQHTKYDGEPTKTILGNNNVIREGATIHRGTTFSHETRIGNNNFLMANSHVAHDCIIGNNCIMANGALLGGHCQVEDNAFISGNAAIHQFSKIGRLSLLSGASIATKDIPPFIIAQKVNGVAGVNVVGMRRAGISPISIDAVRKAFHILYRENLLVPQALAKIEKDLGDVAEVMELVTFIRSSSRGISLHLLREAA